MRADKAPPGAMTQKGWMARTTVFLFVCSLVLNLCFFWITDCRRPVEAPASTDRTTLRKLGDGATDSSQVEMLRSQMEELKQQLALTKSPDLSSTDTAPPSDPDLLKALKKAATSYKQVILLPVSSERVAELTNFLWHAKQAKVHENVLLVALDVQMASKAKTLEKQESIGAFYDMSNEQNWKGPEGLQFGFTAEQWALAVRNVRYSVLLRCLEQGFHVLSTDVDVILLKNPFLGNYLSTSFDLQIMSNSHSGFAEEDDDSSASDISVSGGFHYSIAGQPSVQSFYRGMLEAFVKDQNLEAQDYWDEALRFGKSRLNWRYLEPLLYPNGYLYFDMGLPQLLNIEPFAVHNNWCKGHKTKLFRLREAGLWAAEKDRWKKAAKSKKKYLTYFNPVGDNGLNNDRQALRAALAIAEVLNRTLILPHFHRLHHYQTPVTFDYYFDYEAFIREFPNVEPRSFLEGAFPNWKKGTIDFINIGFPPTESSGQETEAKTFMERIVQHTASRYHRGATESELLEWYGKRKEPLLVLFNGFRRFGTWSDPQKQAAWSRKIHRAFKPHWKTTAITEAVSERVGEVSKGGPYNCLHLRLTDFKTVHAASEQPVETLARGMPAVLPTNTTLYISTDEQSEAVRKEFQKAGYKDVIFMTDFFPKWGWPHVSAVDGRIGMRFGQPDQQVCSEAEKFIGNVWSTFSLYIAFMREQEGKSQVCDDVYGRTLDDGMVWQRR